MLVCEKVSTTFPRLPYAPSIYTRRARRALTVSYIFTRLVLFHGHFSE